MSKKTKVQNNTMTDVAAFAKQKRTLLYNFYENVKDGSEILTAEDLDIAIESLKLAKLDIKLQEERKRQEEEAELLKKKLEEEETRRKAAEARAARRAEKRRREHAAEVTAMALPVDFVNSYEDDARANIHCDSIADGLLVSLDALGMVDIEFIASITGEEMKTVIESLKGSIFQNPLHWNECFYKGWETADEYLSGNLMHKYELAVEANETYCGYFDANIKALESVMNPDIDTNDIYITLGSPWVPTDVIDDFILHLIGLEVHNGNRPKDAEPFLNENTPQGMMKPPDFGRFPKKHASASAATIPNTAISTIRSTGPSEWICSCFLSTSSI